MTDLTCFKAYDLRGKVPEELNADIAYRVGRAIVAEFGGSSYVVGQDMRLESPELAQALISGFQDSGADVIDIGLCGTEEVYFATSHFQVDGGVMITASHNPKGYNGMKLVREGARPISGDTGLHVIRNCVSGNNFGVPSEKRGNVHFQTGKCAYIQHLLTYIDITKLKPLKILADPGNGTAGPIIQELQKHLPFEFTLINELPDGSFPNGVPNPLLPESRELTRKALLQYGCDMALAWDGDFDRCFFFDENGRFVEGYYLVGLLAEVLLKKHPGSKIIHDPRLTWNTIERVQAANGIAVQSKTGHAFIKERMRVEDAVYGGEMSAHHYFRDFFYCDSGMIPWLLIAELMSKSGKKLSELVDERIADFPCSGEINFCVANAEEVIDHVENYFQHDQPVIDHTDGLSMEFSDWRFNLRASNTEPLLRLNIEARRSKSLVSEKLGLLESLIRTEGQV